MCRGRFCDVTYVLHCCFVHTTGSHVSPGASVTLPASEEKIAEFDNNWMDTAETSHVDYMPAIVRTAARLEEDDLHNFAWMWRPEGSGGESLPQSAAQGFAQPIHPRSPSAL
jgi:hypothetical protein